MTVPRVIIWVVLAIIAGYALVVLLGCAPAVLPPPPDAP
jgi:hypothetical protein